MKHLPTFPATPPAWIVTWGQSVLGVFPSPDDPKLLALVKEYRENPWTNHLPTAIVLDDPSLDVYWQDGIQIQNASSLASRDNWFLRYESVLESHLRDPRVAQVFSIDVGTLSDPLITHKSSPEGPCPLPKGMSWPRCGFCQKPLAFLGLLDFREFNAVTVPNGSLVLHVCNDCGVCPDRETWAIHWIREGDPVEIHGNREKKVLVGTRWHATEYPVPALYAEELTNTGPFLQEHSFYFQFSCFADKIGGHAFFIQGDCTPNDSRGQPMVYIGQFVGTEEIWIGDCGLAYLFYSPGTGETCMYSQDF